MKKLGLIGRQLSHSFSKKYFEEKFEKLGVSGYSYELFPLSHIERFTDLLKNESGLYGLNVTIPYKETVIPYLDQLDTTAKETGAVNCIKIENGKLTGYNTDVFGFRQSIKPFLEPQHERALILGTGGASKAVAYVLNNIGVPCWFVSRNPKGSENEFSYAQLNAELLSHFKLIVNCTPVGMYPETEQFLPLPYEAIGTDFLVYDLVYNPPQTEFLKKAKLQGAVTINGLSMLYHQADKAWEIWNNG